VDVSARGDPLEARSLGEKAAKKRLYFRLFEGFAVRGAAAMLYGSEDERRRSAGAGGTKAIVVPNPLEPRPRCRPRAVYLQDRWKLPPSSRIVGVSGRIHPQKGFDILIPALARTDPRVCCVVFGPDDGSYARSLVRSAAEHGVAERFRVIGHLDGDELENTYAALDLLVLPSFGESFGNVVLESLAQGTEVMLSSAVPLAAYVESNGFGTVVAEPSAAAWSTALSEWASRGTEFDPERAADRVRKDFDRNAIGRRLYDALREVVDSG
jgi:glycosyltransferase involved in cell wall biosynthesis